MEKSQTARNRVAFALKKLAEQRSQGLSQAQRKDTKEHQSMPKLVKPKFGRYETPHALFQFFFQVFFVLFFCF